MAAARPALFFSLLVFALSPWESASEPVLPPVLPQTPPRLTGCFSTNMETFRCRWTVGSTRELSEPGALRLFFINKKPPPASPVAWSECPLYSGERPNECFFNENQTSVWTFYSVQLRSGERVHDENRFYIHDIVRPDPPVALHWALLNSSLTGSFYDIRLSWRPPPSADVETGWMTLSYEVQHRHATSDLWEQADLVKSTRRSIFGLQADVHHEVRVRCKMFGGKEFGEFSDSVFVHVPFKVSRVPVVALLVFAALCLLTVLMLVVVSQQEKFMVILLPPVPGPKIRGIDPELLKNGKLRELASILGGPLDLRPELYHNDPWVEFIDLDLDEPSDPLAELDTDRLVERRPPSPPDDDSGRASCDPDLPGDPEASSPFASLLPKDRTRGEAAGREALYTQVSEVRSSGKVLLELEEDAEKKGVRLLAAYPGHGGYTSEVNAGKISPASTPGDAAPSSPFSPLLPSSLSSPSSPPLSPAPVYTVVEGVGRQNSLRLTPSSTPGPQLVITKVVPTPDGYLAPELMGSVTP